jgi:hypothetical protein
MPLGIVTKNGEFMQRVRVFKAHKTIGRVMAKKYWDPCHVRGIKTKWVFGTVS